MLINENFLSKKYEEHFEAFRLNLIHDLHEMLFGKYIYIKTTDSTFHGYVISADIQYNEYTHERKLLITAVEGDYNSSCDLALNTIERIFYNETKEQTLLEVECTEE